MNEQLQIPLDVNESENTACFLGAVRASAQISPCGRYRYSLTRIWDAEKPKVLFIMLNPSTADGEQDDPTIRRCIGFAKSWGYGGLYVGNLLAYRATNPKDLKGVDDPFGPANETHLKEMARKAELLVCAWGNPAITKNMMHQTKLIKGLGLVPHYLELTKDGTPKHPLYLKSELKPRAFGGHLL